VKGITLRTMPGELRPTADVLGDVLHDHPAVASCLADAYAAAWRAVDAVLLELCRLRVAMLLGCSAELAVRTPQAVAGGLAEQTVAELAQWPTSARFSARERSCLSLCEQLVMDVTGVSDAQAAEVVDHLGPSGFRDLLAALLVLEQRQRLRLAWEALAVPGAT
jgi:alkylhydroperoxidase family enzyme